MDRFCPLPFCCADHVPDAAGYGRQGVYYQLQPALPRVKASQPAAQDNSDQAAPDELATALGGMQLAGAQDIETVASGSASGVHMLLHSQAVSAVQQVMESAVKAMNHRPIFDTIKLRLGKTWTKGFT